MVVINQPEQLRIVHGPVIKVCSQREDDEQGATRLCHGRNQQFKEMPPFRFIGREGEYFLELVYHQDHFLLRGCYKLTGEQVEVALRGGFKVVEERDGAPGR